MAMMMQSVKMAWKSIFANKSRAFLTMLGIIIGVIALVVLVSLVTSATSSVSSQIASMGTDMLTVSIRDDKGQPLKFADLEKFSEDESIALIAPVLSSSSTMKTGADTLDVSITGTNNDWFSIEQSELLAGRLLLSPDLDNNSYVMVLSYEAAEDVFGTGAARTAVGQTVNMGGVKYTVVGVLAEENSMSMGFSGAPSVYVPYTVAVKASAQGGGSGGMGAAGGSGITSFYAAAKDAESIDRAEAVLTAGLLARFKGDSEAFYLNNMNTLSETMSSVTNTFALLLGGIAAISLLVGGIGIMNIMLVSVTERTREIGIRKAVGAGRRSIMGQFLIEALMICLFGCAIGIAVSGGILAGVNAFASSSSQLADSGITFGFSGGVVLAAVLFSTLIGVLFGLYPANKAAKMHPIDA
ncbi:MAG: ABC transporter permease, partial [Clostridiales Family XIII bacterium]|nr:ABC transporter permease [Clostridiales Family XIII bacterium]